MMAAAFFAVGAVLLVRHVDSNYPGDDLQAAHSMLRM
jgi:hypothetical protein